MTHEEYKIEAAKIDAQLQILSLQKKELNKVYLATSPLKPGDKVLVKFQDGSEVFAFVENLRASYSYEKEPFVYDFLKCKNDGTPSKVSAYFYKSILSIEKVD